MRLASELSGLQVALLCIFSQPGLPARVQGFAHGLLLLPWQHLCFLGQSC